MRRLFSRDRSGPARAVPDNLWERCPQCRQLLYVNELRRNLRVCPKCGYHFRLAARERLALLLDADSFVEEDAALRSADPLGFVSAGERYRDKLAEAQRKTGLAEAVVCGQGLIEGQPLRVAVCDFAFLGASMGTVVGEKIARAAERSSTDGRPLLLVCASGGARMHEGIYSLLQMAKTAAALERLAAAAVPLLTLLTHPTTGGVTASFAALGDVVLAEPGALVGFAGPRVIEQITKQKLPPGAQSAEFLLAHGMIDRVVPRAELRGLLARLLRLYAARPKRPPTSQAVSAAAAPPVLTSISTSGAEPYVPS
ncbi:MAG TPA: acetyl-CoA carboxylase, carboxyltransferase subunit beta [Chloroflexota bacterium]|nr:acetyl-CoA carboxylase, carboxyltransferase subunit beta [Chloroflexota bacterium]HZU04974.1 acetyl-CoA carboxylase, carboxyltransferase subunit beta [Chloroflexota bacterium]